MEGEAPLSQPIPKAILNRHLDTKERARKHGFFPDNSGNGPTVVVPSGKSGSIMDQSN